MDDGGFSWDDVTSLFEESKASIKEELMAQVADVVQKQMDTLGAKVVSKVSNMVNQVDVKVETRCGALGSQLSAVNKRADDLLAEQAELKKAVKRGQVELNLRKATTEVKAMAANA